MYINELKPGDLIFYLDSSGQADHVAIVTNIEENKCFVIHATSGKYNAVVEATLNFEDPYQVLRCTNATLAAQACERAKKWHDFHIPYDKKRETFISKIGDSKQFCHPTSGIKNWHEYASRYYKTNFFRIIKFASRRNLCPVNTDSSRGFRCSQFVILCFQVEQLAPFVRTCDELGVSWISDKYATKELFKELNLNDSYLNYQKSLSKMSEYPIIFNKDKKRDNRTQPRLPSLVAWKSSQSLNAFIENHIGIIPLDSKISSAAILQYELEQNSQWINLGPLQQVIVSHSPKDKKDWKTRQEQKLHQAATLSTQQRPRCNSPNFFWPASELTSDGMNSSTEHSDNNSIEHNDNNSTEEKLISHLRQLKII